MRRRAVWADPLLWSGAVLLLLIFGMPLLTPLFHAWFPELERPLYLQETFPALVAAHLGIVAASSAVAIVLAWRRALR